MADAKWFHPILPFRLPAERDDPRVVQYTVKSGTEFLSRAYFRAEKAEHPGDDVNSDGSCDSDLNAPIRMIADGEIVYLRRHAVWGWVGEAYLPGAGVWWMFAHMNQINFKVGQQIEAGRIIATVGKGGGGRFCAHLHHEIRKFGPKDLPPDDWPSSRLDSEAARAEIRRTRVAPLGFLEKMGALKRLPPPRQSQKIA